MEHRINWLHQTTCSFWSLSLFFFFLNPTRDVFKRATYSTICTLFSTIFPQSQIVFVLPDASYAVAGFSFFWGSLSSPTSARLHVTVITVELEMDRK